MIKPLLYLAVLFFSQLTVYSATYVVSNQPGVPRDFSSIQSAIESASPFDTIFVKGSPTNYGNVLLEKPLVLIGEGFSEEEHSGHTAKLTRIVFTSNPYRRTSSSGSTVIGFEFPYFPGQRANITTVANDRGRLENITFERNWFWFAETTSYTHNWIFRNNVIRGWVDGRSKDPEGVPMANEYAFYNNIINSLMGFSNSSIIVENNVILGRLKDISGATINNNIFTREENFLLENVFGSQFNNNISIGSFIGDNACYQKPDNFASAFLCEGTPNTGNGNLVGVDPQFVYWPSDDIMGGGVFKLSESSPARRNRTAAREAGIFGGKYPFPSSSFMSPEIEDPFPSFITSIF